MSKHRIATLLSLFLIQGTLLLHSQFIPHSIRNSGIHNFIEELAAAGLIEVNSTIKPWSRHDIARWLQEANEQSENLSPRQMRELAFYLRDFGKELAIRTAAAKTGTHTSAHTATHTATHTGTHSDSPTGRSGAMPLSSFGGGKDGLRYDLFHYSDDRFSITANPIFGGEIHRTGNGTATYWRNGAEAWATVGNNWGFWASLRDNHEKPLLGRPQYLTKREGGHIKGASEWSEMRAGISYAWEWGHIAMANDLVQWGSGYNGTNIFGGHNPPFFMFSLRLQPVAWFELNYLHGSLNSMEVDSTRSYFHTNAYGTVYREVMHRKYLASNMLTFKPLPKLHLSAGNSIVYSGTHTHEVFFLPLLFFKSIDHALSSGGDNMNSMMFFDISSRQITNLHLYATWFIDELSVFRFFNSDEHNFFSYKAGFALYNTPITNLFVNAEFTFTYPLSFQHYIPTLTFETNRYNLGHYLKDNAREWYFALGYRPLRTADIRLWYSDAIRGPDYTSLGGPRVGNPILETVEWHNRSAGITATGQIINDLYINIALTHSRITGLPAYTPELLRGTTTTISAGITAGF